MTSVIWLCPHYSLFAPQYRRTKLKTDSVSGVQHFRNVKGRMKKPEGTATNQMRIQAIRHSCFVIGGRCVEELGVSIGRTL